MRVRELFATLAQRPPRRAMAVAGALVVAMTATASVASQGSPTERQLDRNTVASGVVTKDGTPAEGVDVVAEVWPNQEILDTLGNGDEVPTLVAAQTTTDADGWFALALDPAALDPQYLGQKGQVDIALTVADPAGEIRWNFSAQRNRSPLVDSAWTNPRLEENLIAEHRAQDMASTHLLVDIGKEPYAIEEGNHPAEWIGRDDEPMGQEAGLQAARVERASRTLEGSPEIVEAAAMPRVVPAQSSCGWFSTSSYQTGRSEDYVRALGLTYANVTATQTVSASHTLGVAYSAGSTWSQSGTRTKSTTASSTTNYGATNSKIQNKVNYRKYERRCLPGDRLVATEWRPHSFHSLNTNKIVMGGRPNWNKTANCTAYSYGTHEKTQGSNATYTYGVNLAQIGVSANASFGESQAVRLSWTFDSAGGRLCGSTSFGWSSPSSPQAGAFVTP